MPNGDLYKKRDILFAKFPPGQIPEATDDLRRLGALEVAPRFDQRSVAVSYDLQDHTLRELDEYLVERGYHLDNTLITKLTRALIYYLEDTQLHNIGAPEIRLKRSSQEAYVQAWEHHSHGDRDETPPEWREYK